MQNKIGARDKPTSPGIIRQPPIKPGKKLTDPPPEKSHPNKYQQIFVFTCQQMEKNTNI